MLQLIYSQYGFGHDTTPSKWRLNLDSVTVPANGFVCEMLQRSNHHSIYIIMWEVLIIAVRWSHLTLSEQHVIWGLFRITRNNHRCPKTYHHGEDIKIY